MGVALEYFASWRTHPRLMRASGVEPAAAGRPVVIPEGLEGTYEVRTVASARTESQDGAGVPKFRRAGTGRPPLAVRRFAQGLSREERMLVVLKRELYGGSWDEMVADLQARLAGRPYIFKLAHRITDDLERIAHLRRFEEEHGVDLSQYVEAPA